jgi:putative ABC transport system substrate-binding protein
MPPTNRIIALLTFACCTFSGEAARIAVVQGHQTSFRESADAVCRALERAGHSCTAFSLEEELTEDPLKALGQALSAFSPDVIACAGARATESTLAATENTPVVAFMVPNLLDASFIAADHPDRGRVAAVAADVNPQQLLSWIRNLHPTERHIAVLHSPRTSKTVFALQGAARAQGITLTGIEASADAFPKAIDSLAKKRCDGVLMLPDSAVYNAPNVKRLLLWGIRQRKCVWAFSESIVKAGALAGQYPDADSVAGQATRIIQRILDGESPGDLPVQYVPLPRRAVNMRTAEMIGVRLRQDAFGPRTARFGEDE